MIFNKTTLRLIWPLLALYALLAPADAAAQRLGLWPDGGTALPLVRHDVQVNINHPVAETVVTQEFDNTHTFDLEATFYYPVPAGATVAGMALWVKGERREARMLERQKAREIYDGIVRKNRDPALLERVDGNMFKIRIFPVLARTRTRVEVRFVQPVAGGANGRYSLTLRKPPGATIHALRLGVQLNAPFALSGVRLSGYPAGFRQQGQGLAMARRASVRSFTRDITLSYGASGGKRTAAMAAVRKGGEQLVVAEIPSRPRQAGVRRVAVLVDVSKTMRPHLPAARKLTRHLLDSLDDGDRAAVVPFDLLPRGSARLAPLGLQTRARLASALDGLSGDRGTAFVPAFRAALDAGARHIICITDGGSRYHQAELEALLRLLWDSPHVTVSMIRPEGMVQAEVAAAPATRGAVSAQGHNADAAQDLARSSGGLFHALGSESDLVSLADRLVGVPRRVAATLPDDTGEVQVLSRDAGRLLLALRLPLASATATVRLHAEQPWDLPLDLRRATTGVRGAGALVASASISALMRKIKLVGEEPALRESIVKLSKDHMVLSEYTALLATETDAQYNNPTSGRKWQRQTPGFGDDLPSTSFGSTPEPHEIMLIGLAMLALMAARKKGWLGAG